MSVASVIPDKLRRLFGPQIDPTDQAAAEALDSTGASATIRPMPSTDGLPTPQASPALNTKLVEAAKSADIPSAPPATVPNSLADVAGLSSSKPDASQLPSLARQGGSAIPHSLLRMIGLVGDNPKPGELYDGPTTTGQKIGAGMGFVGRLGNALAAAAGTPQQQELAEKRSEFGPELKAKTDIAKAQIESLGDYRQGRIQNAADQVEINKQKADQANQQATAKMRTKGQVPDEAVPGTFRSMTPDEILADPVLSQKQDLAQAASLQKNAEAKLANARQDALMNPSNPTLALKARQIEATLKMAQANLALRQHALSNQDAGLAIRQKEMQLQYGIDANGNKLEDSNNIPSEMMVDNDSGRPIPYKMNPVLGPTANMRTMQQMSQTIQPMMPRILDQVGKLSDKIGPSAGRWNDFWVNKGGVNDPDFAGLNQDLTLYATALGKAHFGNRIPASFVADMMKQFGMAQSPEDLTSRIEHADNWINGYAAARPKTVGGGDSSTNMPNTPAAGGAKLYLFPDGKKRSVAPNMVREAIADGARETQ